MQFVNTEDLERTCDALGIQPRSRETLRLILVEGLDSAEVAERLGVKRSSVQVTVGRFRKRVAEWEREQRREPESIPYPDEGEEEDLSLREEGRALLDSMRGHAKAHPPKETEDEWGRHIGLKTSPLVSVDDAVTILCMGRRRRARRADLH